LILAGFKTGAARDQPLLLPALVDDYVQADAAVRVIDAFVASLDMHRLGFERARPAATGRPGYDPCELLRLYIYGYLNSLRSSRKLERACHINLELIWLLRQLAPDFKTIADFRRDNHPGIIGACRAFVQFCRDAGLFAGTIAAIDGTKLRAAASRKMVMDKAEVAAETAALDQQIGDYLLAMDAADATDVDDTSHQQTQVALRQLRARREALSELAAEMAAEARDLGVRGEPQARPMGSGAGAKPPSYNVQIAVDPNSHIIVHHEVTTEATDNRMLHPMASATKAVLGAERLSVVADAGYTNASQAAACEAEAILPAVPAPRPTNTRGAFFASDQFIHDAASDSMTCPAGRKLLRNGFSERDQSARYRAQDCSGCPLKQNCTTAPARYVYRHVHHDAMQRMNQRVQADKTLMKLRRSTAEHPFGTLKAYLGNRFLLRGTLKAATETALAVLGYNLTRAINILGRQALVERLA
jgi:transposase